MRVRGTGTESVELKTFVNDVGDSSANIVDDGMQSHQISVIDTLLLPIPAITFFCDFIFGEFSDVLGHSLEPVGEYVKDRVIMRSTYFQVDEVNAIMHN